MPARRFVLAQSWWLASALVRRHPGLRLIETHPGGGQYDCLSLLRAKEKVFDINRNGSVHVGEAVRELRPMAMDGLFDQEQAWTYVRELEEVSSVGVARHTPSSTPAVLTYRVIAELMAITLNDRKAWDVRNEFEDTSDWGGGPRHYVQGFPLAAARVQQRREDDLLGIAEYRFWGVLSGGEAVAVLDTDGNVYVGEQVFHLPEVYRSHNRRLTATVAATLGTVLP
jgi:hypothetical protein